MVAAAERDELEDFEAFLEPGFRASQFANDLILATNDNEDSQLDLITPIKKLKFDINECEKRMKSISSNNHDALISHFGAIEDTRSAFSNHVNPAVERANNSFDRLRENVIKPYDDALKMNNAMKRIHSTLTLVRGSGYFIFLVQQLEDSERAYDTQADADKSNNKEIVRLAKLHEQLTQFYDSQKEGSKSVQFGGTKGGQNLLSIKLIRDYQSIQFNKRVALSNELSQLITKDINHHGSFSISNLALQNNLVALYLLSSKDFIQAIDKSCIAKHSQTSLTQLTRSLQSPRNFTSVIQEIKSNSEAFINTLTLILKASDLANLQGHTQHQNVLDQDGEEHKEDKNLYDIIVKNLKDSDSISKYYWTGLSYKFKKNIVATMARGGPIAKNLKVYHTGIRNTIEDTFSGSEKDLLLDAVDIIGSIDGN